MKALKIALFAFVAMFATQSFAEVVEPFSYSNFQAQMQNLGSVFGNSSNFNNGGFIANGNIGDQNGFTSYSAGTNIGGVIMPQQAIVDGNSGHHANGNSEGVGSNASVIDVGVNANRSQGVASSSTNTHAITNATSMGGMSSTSFADVWATGLSVAFPPFGPPAQ